MNQMNQIKATSKQVPYFKMGKTGKSIENG